MVTNIHLKDNKEEIAQAQEKLPKGVEGGDELEMSWWMTCVNVSLLHFYKGGCEEHEIIVE